MISNVLEYFLNSAERYPQKDAVVCDGESVTYEALNSRTSQLAQFIAESTSDHQAFIPFVTPKSIPAIEALLSILKLGAAYIPVDAKSPVDRMRSIFAASEAKTVMVVDETEPVVKEAVQGTDIQVINIDTVVYAPAAQVEVLPKTLSIDLAYVLFTSGSTGVPKGVMIPHRAIIDYIDWCVETYEITASDVVSNHAPLYFDNSTFDIYTAFKAGATLHLVPERLNAVLPRLIKWLEQSGITVFFCVPSVLTMLLKSRRLKPESFPKLRRVLAAGEALPPQVLREWMLLYPHIEFTNMYGPTEITVDCSFHNFTTVPDEDCTSVPIGKPRKNMEMFVLTENGQLTTEVGSKGELLVRGTSVAYGYLNDSEKTAAAFIQNPNHSLYPDVFYKTGDNVTIDENNDFYFIGRSDNQIKYLGYRIELGEIESKLLTLPEMSECVVAYSESQEFIGAYYKLEPDHAAEGFEKNLTGLLPPYMIPTVFLECHGDYPRTPNGKYDRKQILKLLESES